jgi:outer membrane protein assembly factor BamB
MKRRHLFFAVMGLFCGTQMGHGQTRAPGEMIWSFATEGALISSPAVAANGTIYVGSDDRKLYAINPDGSLKWSFLAGSLVESSPMIGPDGTIYVGSNDRKLYAINPDGTKKWEYRTGDQIFSSPAIGSDGTVYVGSLDHRVYAIDSEGFLLWYFTTPAEVRASPSVTTNGTIYVGAGTNFFAINPDGTQNWVFAASNVFYSSAAIASDGTIYVGCTDKKLYALTSAGAEKWESKTSEAIYGSPSIGPDGIVYAGSYDNKLYAIRTNSFQKWTFTTGGDVHSSAAIGEDGTIYIGSNDRKLYSISGNGTMNWSFVADKAIRGSPAIAPDGTVYVGSDDGNLYAIQGAGRLARTSWPMFRHDLGHRGRLGATNASPVLDPVPDQTVAEGQPLQVALTASDPDGDGLTFSLDAGAPAGVTISTNGILDWIPTEAQGPGDYNFTARVTDDGSPNMSDFRAVKVSVLEVNSAPVLASISNLVVSANTFISFHVLATDADLPANSLTFSLDGNAPAGAAINPSSGLFTWQPGNDEVGRTNDIFVRVNDNPSPSLSDAKSFSITIFPRLGISRLNSGLSLFWKGVEGMTYQVQYTSNLSDVLWNDLNTPVQSDGVMFTQLDSTIGSAAQRFYRINLR